MFLAGSPVSLKKSNFEHFEQLLRKGGQGVSQKYLWLFAIFCLFLYNWFCWYVDMRLTTRMMRLVIPPCLVVCYHNTSYCDFPCLPPSETAHTNTSHFFGELSTTLQINVRKITFFLLTQVAFLTGTFTSQSWTVGILGLKNTFWTFLINLQFFMLLSWWSTQLVQGANTHNIGD